MAPRSLRGRSGKPKGLMRGCLDSGTSCCVPLLGERSGNSEPRLGGSVSSVRDTVENSCRDVHGYAGEILAACLAPAGVQSGPDFDAEAAGSSCDGRAQQMAHASKQTRKPSHFIPPARPRLWRSLSGDQRAQFRRTCGAPAGRRGRHRRRSGSVPSGSATWDRRGRLSVRSRAVAECLRAPTNGVAGRILPTAVRCGPSAQRVRR
jgi:hypothetical protein